MGLVWRRHGADMRKSFLRVKAPHTGIDHYGKWLRPSPWAVWWLSLSAEMLDVCRPGTYLRSHLPCPSTLWASGQIFLSHGEALELSLGSSVLDIAGEAEGAVRSRHKVANKPTTSNCYLDCLPFFYIEFLEIPPFNKQYTESQLRAGAGYILEDFNEAQVRSCFVKLPGAQWWSQRCAERGPRGTVARDLRNGERPEVVVWNRSFTVYKEEKLVSWVNLLGQSRLKFVFNRNPCYNVWFFA